VYGLAGLGAGVIPLTALSLLVATVRMKTVERGGAARDPTADAGDDPFPGIGMDDATPLGDTSEHSDADEGAPVGDRPHRGAVRR
jgi:hypothetical protein